jgi:hypothetical protein
VKVLPHVNTGSNSLIASWEPSSSVIFLMKNTKSLSPTLYKLKIKRRNIAIK